ncbi:MAG: thioredoxin family protein, partial [Bacteroidota bacterium]
EIVENNAMVMVQYGATWCGNCRITKPKFKRLATENEHIKFVYVDAEKQPNSRSLTEVKNLPTFAAFKNGQVINTISGNKPSIITDLLNEITAN